MCLNLFKYINSFCEKEADNGMSGSCGSDCTHEDKCPLSLEQSDSINCYDCMRQIHYPAEYSSSTIIRERYDCRNIVIDYVNKYLNKYASEILHALNRLSFFKDLKDYNIISVGCGPAPDLMAFEKYLQDNSLNKKINYLGFDCNHYWEPIQNKIKDYCKINRIEARFPNIDIMNSSDLSIEIIDFQPNILILQYFLSSFGRAGQNSGIDFFDYLIENIIPSMDNNSIIVINDINYKDPRDSFATIKKNLENNGYKTTEYKLYFNYNIRNLSQQYGRAHSNYDTLFIVDGNHCTSAQYILRFERIN